MRLELARAHARDLGGDLQKRGVPSARLGERESERAGEAERLRLTSRDGIKDGDFPVDRAH